MVLNIAVYRLSIFPFFSEIFAVKVESCPNSRRILDVFLLSQILRKRCSAKIVPGLTCTLT